MAGDLNKNITVSLKLLTTGFKELASLADEMSKLGTQISTMAKFGNSAAQNVTTLVEGLKPLKSIKVSDDLQKLGNFATSFGTQGAAAAGNINTLKNSLNSLSTIVVPPSFSQFTKDINKLSDAKTTTAAQGLNTLAVAVRNFAKGEKAIPNTQATATKITTLSDAVVKFSNASKLGTSTALARSMQRVVDVDVASANANLTKFAISTKKVKNALSGTVSKDLFTELKAVSGIQTQGASVRFKTLAARLRSLNTATKNPKFTAFTNRLTSLSAVSTAEFNTQLRAATVAIRSFKTATGKANFAPLLTPLRALSAMQLGGTAAAITSIADATGRFKKSAGMTQIGTFVSSLEKLNNTISSTTTAAKLDKIANSMRSFSSGNIPKLSPFIKGLKDLTQINTGTAAAQLKTVAKAMEAFDTTAKLPGLTAFAVGLQRLVAVDTQAVVKRLVRINQALLAFKQQGTEQLVTELAKLMKSLGIVGTTAEKAASKLRISATNIGGSNKQIKEHNSALVTWLQNLQKYSSYRIIADVTQLLKTAFRGGITAIIDYSQALKDLQAITTATDDEVSQMGSAIKQTASDTKFLVTEVAAAMKILGQAGLSAAESSMVIGDVANLATGTLSDMAGTVDLVTTAMRVFKIEAQDSGRIVDAFANAVNKSKLTIDKIRTSFNYVGPVAREAGLSFEETQASLMTLANSGLRASTMGTGLRRILAELAAPSEKFSKAAKAAGVSMAELDPESNDLSSVLRSLGLVLSDTSVAFDIFGKRGAAAALALTSQSSGFDDMYNKVSITGTAASMAGTQMEGLGIAFKKVVGKAQLLMVAIGDLGLTTMLGYVAKAAQVLLDTLTSLSENAFVGFIIQITVATAAIASLIVAFSGLKIALGVLATTRTAAAAATTSITALTGSMTLLHNSFIGTAARATVATFSLGRFSIGARVAAGFAIGLTAALGWIAAAMAVIGAAFWIYDKMVNGASKAATAQRELAESYNQVQDSLDTMQDKLMSSADGSQAQVSAGQALREKLHEIAEEYTGVSAQAQVAASMIDPVTGKLLDQGAALNTLNDAMQEQELIATKRTLRLAEEATSDQTGWLGTLDSQLMDSLKGFGNLAGSYTSTFLRGTRQIATGVTAVIADQFEATSSLSRRLRELVEADNVAMMSSSKSRADEWKQGLGIQEAEEVLEQFENRKLSYEELKAAAEKYDRQVKQSGMEKEVIKQYKLVNSAAGTALSTLQRMAGAKYSPTMDTAAFTKLIDEFLDIDDASGNVTKAIIARQENLVRETQKATQAQIDAYKSIFSDIGDIVDGVWGLELPGTATFIQQLSPDRKALLLEHAKTAKDISAEWQAAATNVVLSRNKLTGLAPNSKAYAEEQAAFTAHQAALIAIEKRAQEARSAALTDPALVAKVAAAQEDRALAAQIASARRVKNEVEIDGEINRLKGISAKKQDAIKKQFHRDEIARIMATLEATQQAQQSSVIEQETVSIQRLSDARIADTLEVTKNTAVSKAGLNINKAVLANKKDSLALRAEEAISLKESLQKIKQEIASGKLNKDQNEELQKVKKQLIENQKKQLTLQKGIATEEAKVPKLIDASKRSWERYNALKAKTIKLQREYALTQKVQEIDAGPDSEIVKLKAVQQLHKVTHDARMAQLQEQANQSITKTGTWEVQSANAPDVATKAVIDKQIADELGAQEKLQQEKTKLRQDYSALTITLEKTYAKRSLATEKAKFNSMEQNYDAYISAIQWARKADVVSQKDAANAELEVWRQRYDRGLDDTEKFSQEARRLTELGADTEPWERATGAVNAFVIGIKHIEEDARSLEQVMVALGKSIKEAFAQGVANSFVDSVEALGESLGDMKSGIKDAKAIWRDFAKDFLRQIARMIMQALIMKAINSAINGFSKGGSSDKSTTEATTHWADVKLDASNYTLATGGKVGGSSPTPTADNIPAWLTAGEYVHPVKAVKKYGSRFMESVRNLSFDPTKSLQGYALGGMIGTVDFAPKLAYGGTVPRMATGGTVPDVNVTTGDTKLNVMNVVDKNMMGEYLNTSEGERTLINFIGKNRSTLGPMMR